MKRYAVTVHVTMQNVLMIDARTKDEAVAEAEAVGMGFRNAVKAQARAAVPATTEAPRRTA